MDEDDIAKTRGFSSMINIGTTAQLNLDQEEDDENDQEFNNQNINVTGEFRSNLF